MGVVCIGDVWISLIAAAFGISDIGGGFFGGLGGPPTISVASPGTSKVSAKPAVGSKVSSMAAKIRMETIFLCLNMVMHLFLGIFYVG